MSDVKTETGSATDAPREVSAPTTAPKTAAAKKPAAKKPAAAKPATAKGQTVKVNATEKLQVSADAAKNYNVPRDWDGLKTVG